MQKAKILISAGTLILSRLNFVGLALESFLMKRIEKPIESILENSGELLMNKAVREIYLLQ
jgi:hypothetical protein